jgi:threonine/homoserine/homoserine lactone efflux protein
VDTSLLAFCLLAIALTVTPGADMALVGKSAVTGGRRAAMLTTLGIAAGCSFHVLASALGLSAILAKSAVAFELVKTIGAFYLIWIGLRTIRAAALPPASSSAEAGSTCRVTVRVSARRCFVEGALTNVLNPKVALFYLMILPQFIAPGQNVVTRSLVLAAIHVGFGLIWLTVYAALLDRMRSVLSRPHVRAWFERVSGGVIVLLGGRLAFERSR